MKKFLQDSPSAMVKTAFWEDEEMIDSHSMEDRYALLCLLTNRNRHVSGVSKLNFRLLGSYLGWDRQQVQIVLDRLEKLDAILIVDGWIWVKSHFDHNSRPSPTHFKQIFERIVESPEMLRQAWLEDAKERGIDTEAIGYPYPIDGVWGNYNNKNNNMNNDNTEPGQIVVDNLVFPGRLDARLIPSVKAALAGHQDAQQVLDELAAALDAGSVKNPTTWAAAVVKKGLRRSPAGLLKESARLNVGRA